MFRGSKNGGGFVMRHFTKKYKVLRAVGLIEHYKSLVALRELCKLLGVEYVR